jgi:SAM-dependent methyltransferase
MLKVIKKQLKLLIFSGNTVYCPCCGKGFITFLPFNYRHGAECPNCLSLERHRLMSIFFSKNAAFQDSSKKVLHIGPEKCLHDLLKKRFKSNYVPGDKFEEGYTGYGTDTVNLDVTDLKFPDNSFDIILCNHVLEHVQEDRKAMREMYRVLKPGGFAILQVDIDYRFEITNEDPSITDPKEREKHYGQFDHVRVYGRDYKNRLEEAAGFKVEIDQLSHSFDYKELFRNGLYPGEDIYVCHK